MSNVWSVSFSSDGKYVASAGSFDKHSEDLGSANQQMSRHSSQVTVVISKSVSFSGDGKICCVRFRR